MSTTAKKPTVAQLAEQVAQLTELLSAAQATPTEARTNERKTEQATPVVKLATGAQAFVAIQSKGGKDKASKRYGDGPRVRFVRVNGRGAAYTEATLRRDTLDAIRSLSDAEYGKLTKALDAAQEPWEALAENEVSA
jgi:hypothetical protein